MCLYYIDLLYIMGFLHYITFYTNILLPLGYDEPWVQLVDPHSGIMYFTYWGKMSHEWGWLSWLINLPHLIWLNLPHNSHIVKFCGDLSWLLHWHKLSLFIWLLKPIARMYIISISFVILMQALQYLDSTDYSEKCNFEPQNYLPARWSVLTTWPFK